MNSKLMVRHPCFFTKGYGFLKNKQGVRSRLLVSDYFTRQAYIEKWRFQTQGSGAESNIFTTPRFPHTCSNYINYLVDEGFILKQIQEPRPSEKICRRYSNLLFWRQNAALFLFVHALVP